MTRFNRAQRDLIDSASSSTLLKPWPREIQAFDRAAPKTWGDACTNLKWPVKAGPDFTFNALALLRVNHWQWHLEDASRKASATRRWAAVGHIKAKIDLSNARRTAWVTDVDALLFRLFQPYMDGAEDADINSESPGTLLDRLTVQELKVNHLWRAGKGARPLFHAAAEQALDLWSRWDSLILNMAAGKRKFVFHPALKFYGGKR